MDAAKAVLRGKFIVIQAFLKKQKKINKQPNLPPKVIRKRARPKVNRRKELIKIREEMNKIETKIRKDQ